MRRKILIAATAALHIANLGQSQDWGTVPYVEHSGYQAVNGSGSSVYDGTFPVRFVGVVLNNTEDWLDPTAGYTATYQPFNLGGQSEFYIQAVNLDSTAWDPFPLSAFDDFGGTAVWIGQNYGNLPFLADPIDNYTDLEWAAELGRLNLYGGDGVTNPIRAGDLVEVRARGGLNFGGKMNVNEQHSKLTIKDYEIVTLVEGFGLPAATKISLSDVKDSGDDFIFDATRLTGGEHYQGSLVEIENVWITSAATWTANSSLTVTDGTRSFTVQLGRNGSFDGTELFAAGDPFNVVGIFDQNSPSDLTGGYKLLAMSSDSFAAVPEPSASALLALGICAAWGRRRRV